MLIMREHTKKLALTNSYIRTPQTSINLNGKISDRSQLQVAVAIE